MLRTDSLATLRTCASWCTDGDGHPDQHPDDRSCWSDYLPTTLTLYPLVRTAGEHWEPRQLDIVLQWRPETAQPHVVLFEGYEDTEIRLTLNEASTLLANLTRALTRVGAWS